MLIRISLIVAIVAGLAIGVLNFVTVKTKITTLISERDDWHTKYDTTYATLTKTKKDLETTSTQLKQTKDTLESTTAERDQAVQKADVQTKRANQLADELAKTKTDRDDAQAQLAAYKAAGFTSEQVLGLGKTLKDTQDALAGIEGENGILMRKITVLTNELAKYKTPDYRVPLPASLKGKILVSDPKWDFVVLNVGEDQGVLPDGELLVSRDGRFVERCG